MLSYLVPEQQCNALLEVRQMRLYAGDTDWMNAVSEERASRIDCHLSFHPGMVHRNIQLGGLYLDAVNAIAPIQVRQVLGIDKWTGRSVRWSAAEAGSFNDDVNGEGKQTVDRSFTASTPAAPSDPCRPHVSMPPFLGTCWHRVRHGKVGDLPAIS